MIQETFKIANNEWTFQCVLTQSEAIYKHYQVSVFASHSTIPFFKFELVDHEIPSRAIILEQFHFRISDFLSQWSISDI
jgi:hypothetical protein